MSFGDDTLDPTNAVHINAVLETKIRLRIAELQKEEKEVLSYFLSTERDADFAHGGIDALEWVLREAGLKC